MNARFAIGLFVLAFPLAAAAAPPASSPIVVSCQQRNWPSLERVAQEAGVNAFDPVPHVRKRAIIAGLRACRHGATDLALVFEKPRVRVKEMEVALADPAK
ncbi:MAG TPA: hypothetical protein VGE88_18005 [Lysobacter sp.]